MYAFTPASAFAFGSQESTASASPLLRPQTGLISRGQMFVRRTACLFSASILNDIDKGNDRVGVHQKALPRVSGLCHSTLTNAIAERNERANLFEGELTRKETDSGRIQKT